MFNRLPLDKNVAAIQSDSQSPAGGLGTDETTNVFSGPGSRSLDRNRPAGLQLLLWNQKMPEISFFKLHGAGNDYVYLDCFHQSEPQRPSDLAKVLADRHKGIGGDGLILVCPSSKADARMRMFNADGSEAEMCGNGIRCVAKLVHDLGICPKDRLEIETGAGILGLDLRTENGTVTAVRVNMGQPILEAARIPSTFSQSPVVNQPLTVDGRTFSVCSVSMGNPHCVIYVPELTDELVLGWGPKIETCPEFPKRVNVEFVQVISPREVRQRTWERGSGETQACGTGASAVCVAGVLSGRTERKISNHLLGGTLELEWDEATGVVYMTGPAELAFTGNWKGTW